MNKTDRAKSNQAGKSKAAETPPHDGFQTVLAELEGIRDDLRVRMHRVGMELQDVWSDIDRRYLLLRDNAPSARDEAVAKIRGGLAEVRKDLHMLRVKLDGSVAPAAAKPEAVA